MPQEVRLSLKVEGKNEYIADIAEVKASLNELKELLEQVEQLLRKIGIQR